MKEKNKEPLFHIVKRDTLPLHQALGIRALAILLALILCGIITTITTGINPIEVYRSIFTGAFGSVRKTWITFQNVSILLLIALALTPAFKMKFWNIGGEGQVLVGGLASAACMICLGNKLPNGVVILCMIVASILAGACWGFLPAFFKAKWNTNETLFTLMMNYIAILWVNYLVYGAWRDPKGLNFPLTAAFSESALLPSFGDLRVHAGIIIVFVLAAVLAVVFRDSRWGYETLVIGSNPTAARYAGINIPRNVLLVMLLSGAVCGMGGMIEVSGIVGKLQPGISPGYGYTAIIVAWLARLHPAAIIVVAFLFAIIHVGGFMVQTLGIPSAVATMLQGAILFFVVGADIFTNYQLRLIKNEGGEESE